ncbi:MAG: ABC transporter ATP-binding protein [Syntrophorhabdaceae bacterium]
MIDIRGLTCGYGKKVVLNTVDLCINKGEFFGIIGPNGSGKTTILRCITRLAKISKGEVLLDGRNMKDIPVGDSAKIIAVVSQNMPSLPMTVEEFILLGRIPYYNRLQFSERRSDISIAEKVMDLTGIRHLRDSLISEMSAGEVQLAFIARGLAQEPKLLLLDEPTSHLDITHQVSVLDLIKRLNRQEGLTVVIVLHDLNLASEYCDRLALVDNGTIKKCGTPDEVLTYRMIEDVYKTVVVVHQNPLSMKPFVMVVSQEVKHTCERNS